jgi:phage terminase small subunit
LLNSKHERFAQELAKGKTADEAYVLAGYVENRKNASRLKTNEDVQGRLAELLERAAARTEITIAGITSRLMNLAAVAEQTGIKKDEETGDVTGSSSKHLSVARAALMDAAKLNGLITDKVDMDTKHSISPEMEAWLNQRA